MSRIEEAFRCLKADGRCGLIAFLTVGYPEPGATSGLVEALLAGGADMIELGIPFSDPLADGVTVQRATSRALSAGVTPAFCLQTVRDLRSDGIEAPLLLMGYYNPILAYGEKEFARDAAAAGADGLIVLDLPPEESRELAAACRSHALDWVPLIAPTSSLERIRLVAGGASGFIYCVSVAGVTGVRADIPVGLSAFLRTVRSCTDLPLAVGFGISKPRHLVKVRRLAEAAVIGSAIVDVIERADPSQREKAVQEYVEVVTGRRRAAV